VQKFFLVPLQPETANQLKFNFFPDIVKPYTKDFLWDTVQHRFPNGRRRREIATDPMTGQKYERYEAEVNQIGDSPLWNESSLWDYESEDEEFNDLFEEDIEDKKMLREFFMQQRNENHQKNDLEESDELNLSRWVAYDSLGRMLER
jgi:hypothetical protein